MKYEITPSLKRNEENGDEFNIVVSFEIPQMSEKLDKFIDNASDYPNKVKIFNELLNYMESDSTLIKNTENLYIHQDDEITLESISEKYKKFIELYPDSISVFANILNFMIEAEKNIQREANASKIVEWMDMIVAEALNRLNQSTEDTDKENDDKPGQEDGSEEK